MSLKGFHIFFIVVSILFCFGFAAWEINAYRTGNSVGEILAALAAIAVGIGLIVYLRNFMKKLKNVSSV